jgi:SAM-dependent methyltransferase
MNPQDRAAIASRYRRRLRRFGPSAHALASGSEAHQAIRYQALLSLGDLHGTSILDLGCGLGDFLGFLTNRRIAVNYTGYDVSPDLVAHARIRYPGARFEVRDIQQDGLPEPFDYIVASQVFNNRLRHEDNVAVVKDVLRRCYAASRRGVAMDMLTAYADFREAHLYYFSPEEMFAHAKTLTKRVMLRHDYCLFEFTLYLYRDFQGWRRPAGT